VRGRIAASCGWRSRPECAQLFGPGLCRSRLTGSRLPARHRRRLLRSTQVKDFEIFRSKLPAGTELFVAKNTLVKKVIAGTTYEALGPACVGPNAFLFSGEDVASRHARCRPVPPAADAGAHAHAQSARACAFCAPNPSSLVRCARARAEL
jgi:hypothetical protein